MKARHLIALLAVVLWTGLAASGAGAQTASTAVQTDAPPLLPDLARIVERGTLVVAQLNRNLPPIFAEAENGELAGFDIDLARAIAEVLQVKLEIRRTAETFDHVAWQVATGEADLGISFLSRTAARAKHVLFSRPYVTQQMTLLINRVKGLKFRGSCPSVEELARTALASGMVGLVAGSAYVARLREVGPDTQPREYQAFEDMLEALTSGEVAISAQGELVARRFLSENPAARIQLRFCEIGEVSEQIAIAVTPGRDDLLRWVDIFLEEREVEFNPATIIAHEGPWIF